MTKLKFTDFNKLKGIQLKWKKIYIDASHPNETELYLNQKIQLKNMNLKIKII